MKLTINRIIAILLVTIPLSCDDLLEENVYSQLSPENYLSTESGLNTVLTSGYSSTQNELLKFVGQIQSDLFMSGEGTGAGGSWAGAVTNFFTSYTWHSTIGIIANRWIDSYDAILYANIVLENVDNPNFSPEFIKYTKGEALAIRGYNYYRLYDYFGPTIIHTTSTPEELNAARSTDAETRARIEEDLLAAIELLEVEPQNDEYGRFTKGGAMAVLCKYYLNTKQWQNCADMASDIMALGAYELVPDYEDVFSLANEGNSEILWVHPADATPQRVSSNLLALTLPGNYQLTYPNQASFAARIYFGKDFYDSFEAGDTRRNFLVTTWTNTAGNTVNGYDNDQILCLKYEEDPNANGGEAGNDYPEIRYSDILLARAEALNELNGPNTESISLINMVRDRANVTPILLEDFGSKESLRGHILEERGWEFYYEAKRREDLIRHGKLISNAIGRGINADNHHLLYPIPQNELDANPNLVQNEGY